MTCRERFNAVMNFQQFDAVPMIEWAAWWDQTFDRWKTEGLPKDISWDGSLEYFGLDKMICIGPGVMSEKCPRASSHGAGIMEDEKGYESLRPYLYQDESIERFVKEAEELKKKYERDNIVVRIWLDGFFWFPRTLFGIEKHLFAFYDYSDLMHRVNSDLAEYNIRALNALLSVFKPDMVGYAEDMSYNHGPMLSYDLFREFLLPYYTKVNPVIQKAGVKILIDSDGDITTMIPWMQEAGIEGVYPLERQAGVDVAKIREQYPRFLMMGGYDKMVMNKTEKEMRAEFERLLPVMKSGGFIPSVDHQTPPGVSFENYKIYVKLFREYTAKAGKGA